MTKPLRDERGMALIIVLMVVAILTIIVTEFTFSAQVDYHMVRNGLSSLQASLLARSGINIGEALLLHDQDPTVDSFTEEWCPLVGPRGESCLIDETNSGIVIPENMRLRVQIFDEGAKFNVNLTKPANVYEFRQYMTLKQQGQQNPNAMRPFERRLLLLGEILQSYGLQPEAIDNLKIYWERSYQQLCQQIGWDANCNAAAGGNVGGTPGPSPSTATPPAGAGQLSPPDFPSVDDVGVVPGFSPSVLRSARPFVTAFASRRGTPAAINLNTAPRRLLDILMNDPATVDSIISAREEGPIKQPAQLVNQAAAAWAQDPARQGLQSLFGTATSQFFLIRASAIINPNPITGKGGIGRTASVWVRRDPKPGVGANAPPGTARWVLTRVDWQKEGGAALFRDDLLDDDLGGQGSPSRGF